jgi:hypothetical protein
MGLYVCNMLVKFFVIQKCVVIVTSQRYQRIILPFYQEKAKNKDLRV